MVAGNPLLLNVVDIRRVVGTVREVAIEAALDGLTLSTVRVDPTTDLSIAFKLETLSGGVSVLGTVEVPWEGECRRCLEPVTGTLTVAADEVYEERPTEGETYPIENDQIDLEPMVRELVLLALPQNPLCSDGCLGPVPDELPVTVESDEPVSPKLDPRWAALDDLTFDS